MKQGQRPIDFIESLLLATSFVRSVQLSTYRRLPGKVREQRTVYSVPCRLLRDRFNALQHNLTLREEIAFDSIVDAGRGSTRREMHVPMVDFSSPDLRRVAKASALLVAECKADRAALYASGRAYHLYLGVLVSREQWVAFMGRILLLNARGKEELVDSRWVGHRLLGGFAALRWSARSPRYSSFGPPKLMREWNSR